MNTFKIWWEYIQNLLDIDGDIWMGAFTFVVLLRMVLVVYGHKAITAAEAAAYSSAIGAFAYSNRGPKS